MKLLFSLFAIMLFNKECGSNKEAASAEVATTVEKTAIASQEDMTISYQALSRGFFEKIWVTKDELSFTNDRDLKQKTSSKISEGDWNELMKIMKAVDVKSLPNLKAPTDKRLYDGAAIATFSIITKDTTVESSAFDNGYPPKEIEALVNKVLSMKAMTEKQ